jgi:hypothetical protein
MLLLVLTIFVSVLLLIQLGHLSLDSLFPELENLLFGFGFYMNAWPTTASFVV